MEAKEVKRLEDIVLNVFAQERTCIDWGIKKDIGYILSEDDYEFIKPILMAEFKTTYEIGGVTMTHSGTLTSGRIHFEENDGSKKVLIPVSDAEQVRFFCHIFYILEIIRSGFCKKIKYSEFTKPHKDGDEA